MYPLSAQHRGNVFPPKLFSSCILELFFISVITLSIQYTYNIVEVAALWAGVNFNVVRERMDASDIKEISAEYELKKFDAEVDDVDDEFERKLQLQACALCDLERQCPEALLDYNGEYDSYFLRCPQGFVYKPAAEKRPSRIVTKRKWVQRLLPHHGEFDDMPGFEQRLSWLQTALNMGDLSGTANVVRARDLRAWIQEHFPGHRPNFLYHGEIEHSKAHEGTSAVDNQNAENASANPDHRVHKLGNTPQNLLTPVIEKAIAKNGSDNSSEIYTILRTLAESEAPPFYGVGRHALEKKTVEALLWTDSDGQAQALSRPSLAERLRRRRANKAD